MIILSDLQLLAHLENLSTTVSLSLPPHTACALLYILAAFHKAIKAEIPHIIELLNSHNENVRFMATKAFDKLANQCEFCLCLPLSTGL
jgi:hypothetical protein